MKKKNKQLIWKLVPFLLAGLIFVVIPKDSGDETSRPDAITPNSTAGSPADSDAKSSTDSFRVHILDVEQGLSVLIEAGDETLLYDGGDRDTSSLVVSYLQSCGIEDLDYVIASHYDSDHLAGIVSALNAFETKVLLAPDYEADTATYNSFQETVTNHGLFVTHPEVNQTFPFGSGEIRLLAPFSDRYEDENDFSIVVQVTLGDSSLLLTGDATTLSEAEMLQSQDSLESDILVLGHHGSYSSTGSEFFEAVSPEYAIISCGLYNDYGYPHRRIIDLLEEEKTDIYRTDLQGTICFTMTAEDILFETAPSDNLSTGDELSAAGTLTDKANGATDAASSLTEDLSAFPYVLNTYRMRFHLPTCESVSETSAQNRQGSNLTREALIEAGYSPCGSCKP